MGQIGHGARPPLSSITHGTPQPEGRRLRSMRVCMVMMSMHMLSTLLTITEVCRLQVDEDSHYEHDGDRVWVMLMCTLANMMMNLLSMLICEEINGDGRSDKRLFGGFYKF